MTGKEALAFVRRHGIVLERARGSLPSLVDAIAGEPVRGSWWSHPEAHRIFRALGAVRDSPDVLACRLVGGKVTLVDRRLWPALVRLALAGRLPKERLAAVREEHTPSGKHVASEVPFPRWVPPDVVDASRRLTAEEAIEALGPALVEHLAAGGRRHGPTRRGSRGGSRRSARPVGRLTK